MQSLVIKQYNEGAEQIVRSTEALLTNHSENLQRNMDYAQRRGSEQIHLSLERILVPQVFNFFVKNLYRYFYFFFLS